MQNPTAIETIVKYSKDCIVMRFVLNHLQKSLFLTKRLPSPFILPSSDTIKIVINELAVRIDEREKDIGKILKPIFEGNTFNKDFVNGKNSLTLQEIRNGYFIPDINEEFVILLRPLKSKTTGFDYLPGVLYKIDGGIPKEDLDKIEKSNDAIIANDLLNLIINKKIAYEYLE